MEDKKWPPVEEEVVPLTGTELRVFKPEEVGKHKGIEPK